eukprot:12857195-Alexandrium_andersonii.AAC.1
MTAGGGPSFPRAAEGFPHAVCRFDDIAQRLEVTPLAGLYRLGEVLQLEGLAPLQCLPGFVLLDQCSRSLFEGLLE